jgi:hypothetical protein
LIIKVIQNNMLANKLIMIEHQRNTKILLVKIRWGQYEVVYSVLKQTT